jgi:hypothetical protein
MNISCFPGISITTLSLSVVTVFYIPQVVPQAEEARHKSLDIFVIFMYLLFSKIITCCSFCMFGSKTVV